MNDARLARQIVGELPKLVSENIIDAGAAEALRRHYEPRIKPSRSLSIGLAASAIIGGLLVGSGIILLLGHNWDALSKPVRAAIAVLPVLASIGLSGYTILRRMDSAAWREGCGMFYFLSIGTSIALVSQTYHLYNDMAGFLFYWIVLALPVFYLLNSAAAFTGCLACIVAYTFVLNGSWNAPVSPKPFLLLALTLPYYAWHVWKRRESLAMAWASIALAVALALMLAPTFAWKGRLVLACTAYGLLGTVYYLAGRRWFSEYRGFRNPFRSLGSLSIAFISIVLTYEVVYLHRTWHAALPTLEATWFFIIAGLAWLALGADLLRRRMDFNIVAALFPALLAFAIFRPVASTQTLLLVMNAYVLALGAFTLAHGVRRDSLLSMNEGMVLLATLIVCRFFDSHYSFVARGVAFILIGCGFLAANLLVLKKRRERKGAGA